MAHMSPRRVGVSHRRQQRDDVERRRCLLYPINDKEQMYNHLPLIMSFIRFCLIYLDMVLLVHVLILICMLCIFRYVCFLYIFVIMVMLYFWIRLKSNVLFFQQSKNLILETSILWLDLLML
jgi:hypothetical protein